ncbi:SMP-30/gluconolactonase/LRE family protein [Spirosoma flavus]
MKPRHVLTVVDGIAFPEGPAFAPDGSLWAVDLKGESLLQFQRGQLYRYRVGGAPNGIAIDRQGQIWFCDAGQNSIRRFNPPSGQCETICDRVDNSPLHKPNDLAFDPLGNLLFTCPGESRREPSGYVCVLTLAGLVRKVAEGLYFPNGLAFTEGGTNLVVAKTYQHRLWKGRWNPKTTELTQNQVWSAIGGPDGPGGPDGMAFDTDGNLYAAVYGTSEIRVADPNGTIIDRIPLPGLNPTNCAFDPFGRWGLIVTEAERGQVLSISVEATGLPLYDGLSIPAQSTAFTNS